MVSRLHVRIVDQLVASGEPEHRRKLELPEEFSRTVPRLVPEIPFPADLPVGLAHVADARIRHPCRHRLRELFLRPNRGESVGVINVGGFQNFEHLVKRRECVLHPVRVSVFIAEPEPRIAEGFPESARFELRDGFEKIPDGFLAFDVRVPVRDDCLHHVLVVSLDRRFLDLLVHLVVRLSGNPPRGAEPDVGQHVLFFLRFIQRLHSSEDVFVVFLEARLVPFELPELQLLDLPHHAGDEGFVFVVLLFHDPISLSQLFPPLREPPFHRSHRYGKQIGDLRDGIPFEIMEPDRLAELFAQRVHQSVKLLVGLGR